MLLEYLLQRYSILSYAYERRVFMKLIFAIAFTVLATSSTFAGHNDFVMNKVGKYSGFEIVGTYEQGNVCLIEILDISKTIWGGLKAMKVKINDSEVISLTCTYDMENGKLCQSNTENHSILLNPKEGYHANDYPSLYYRFNLDNEETILSCGWLARIN